MTGRQRGNLMKQQRLLAMAAAISEYEAQFGAMTNEEMSAQRRADRAAAITVRPRAGSRKSARPRR